DPTDGIVLPELSGGEVEPDLQLDPLGPPDRVLTADLLDHPAADRVDQAHLLGEGDELSRREHPAVGIRPADQGLDPVHVPGPELDNRLVVVVYTMLIDGLVSASRESQW